MMMNMISRKVPEHKELKNILYGDDLAVVADNEEGIQETLK